MLDLFAKAGESFIITDRKGEIYEQTSGMMKENGYKIVVLNFRNPGYSDMWNPLVSPYNLYHSGKQEEAISLLNDFIATIIEPHLKNMTDGFLPKMASLFALANLLLLMECGSPHEINIDSLAYMCGGDNEEDLIDLSNLMPSDSVAGILYRSVLSMEENARRSIYTSLPSMLRNFYMSKGIDKILRGNTFDIGKLGREKTAVYIIMPDEKKTHHFLVTVFIKQVYAILTDEAQKTREKTLPIRVNFVLDEFCNIPKMSDMPSMLSVSRNYRMRFYLFLQGLCQLRTCYGEDAEMILESCENLVLLASKELSLLSKISELCGSVYTFGNWKRGLTSVSELRQLEKEKRKAFVIHSRYPIMTEIVDIDMCPMFGKYSAVKLSETKIPRSRFFPLKGFRSGVKMGMTPIPFSNKYLEVDWGEGKISW